MAEGHRAVTATGTVFTGAAKLSGVQASSVAAATVVLRDSVDNTGVIVFELELGANDSQFVEVPDIELALGLHATITGTPAGVVAFLN